MALASLSAPRHLPPLDSQKHLASARALMGAGLVLIVLALAWLTHTEYVLPWGYQSRWWGINPLAPSHWAHHLHFPLPRAVAAPRWNEEFRAGIALLWLGYGLVCWSARRAAPPIKITLIITAVFAFALAVVSPPVLTTDVYAYAASGRLAALYGLNPYVVLPYTFLHGVHDPSEFFLAWDLPTVYGPLWTGLCIGLVAALPHGWLWGEVLYLKLVEAVALCLLAGSASQIAEHLQPGRGRLAAILVGMCPLLLIEGVGSGHNDLLMMACLLMSMTLFLKGRYGGAGVWLSCAAGIKLLPLVLLPWLLWEIKRTLPGPARRWAMTLFAGGTLLPLLVGYACFWHGGAIWAALHQRTQSGGHSTLLWAGLTYALLSGWIWGARRPGATPWLMAWSIFSAVFMLTGLGFAFPWYVSWFWPVLMLRGGAVFRALFGAVFVFSWIWESLYGTLAPIHALAGQ